VENEFGRTDFVIQVCILAGVLSSLPKLRELNLTDNNFTGGMNRTHTTIHTHALPHTRTYTLFEVPSKYAVSSVPPPPLSMIRWQLRRVVPRRRALLERIGIIIG